MALIKCHECEGPVSTEAAACPKCGAPPKQLTEMPPVMATPTAQPQDSNRPEETIYSDKRVTVTTTRVIIGQTTYALRNITSVRSVSTSPSAGCAVMLLIGGLLVGAVALAVIGQDISSGIVAGLVGAGIIFGAIMWLRSLKPTYHVAIASASGEANALSAPDRAYIQTIVTSVNDAIVKYR